MPREENGRDESKETPSWGIIELQGDLESRDGSNLESQFVGDLHFTVQSNGIPVLVIGHHILYGKCSLVEPPFAVLERKVLDHNFKFIVKAIVSKKIVFKIRPKPIIASNS